MFRCENNLGPFISVISITGGKPRDLADSGLCSMPTAEKQLYLLSFRMPVGYYPVISYKGQEWAMLIIIGHCWPWGSHKWK